MKGLAVLKPTTSKDGVTKLTLDLSNPIAGLSAGKAATGAAASGAAATPAKSQSVDLTA